MSILKIARMGHPVLSCISEVVQDPTSPEVQNLIRNMVETMNDADGTGLAAPQVHIPLRIVVYFVQSARSDGKDVPLTALINPEITPVGRTIDYDWEGCLSVPGLVGLVPRFTHIRIAADTPDGTRIEQEVDGFHARVLQHECDHLDGILYPQRMDDLSLLIFAEERRHGLPDYARDLMEGTFELDDDALEEQMSGNRNDAA